jgi:hypothetical protein
MRSRETRRADTNALVKLIQSATGEKPKMWGLSITGFDAAGSSAQSDVRAFVRRWIARYRPC